MANVWITEFNEMAIMHRGERVQAPMCAPVAEQAFAFSTATASSAFNTNTRMVRVIADAAAHLAFGAAPSATTSNLKIAANSAEYWGVTPGEKLSIIAGA